MRTYSEITGRSADFIVDYNFYPPNSGGRKVTYQHLRCDFMYEGDDPRSDGIFMIHPEFPDKNVNPIPEDTPVPLSGRASMWILMPEMRKDIHRNRLKVGVRGHFMEGSRKIGDVVVREIVGLYENSA